MNKHHHQQTSDLRSQDHHWQEFLNARTRALETLDIADAAKAGKAWAAFLHSFTTSPSEAADG